MVYQAVFQPALWSKYGDDGQHLVLYVNLDRSSSLKQWRGPQNLRFIMMWIELLEVPSPTLLLLRLAHVTHPLACWRKSTDAPASCNVRYPPGAHLPVGVTTKMNHTSSTNQKRQKYWNWNCKLCKRLNSSFSVTTTSWAHLWIGFCLALLPLDSEVGACLVMFLQRM